jgi:hypothetical protein
MTSQRDSIEATLTRELGKSRVPGGATVALKDVPGDLMTYAMRACPQDVRSAVVYEATIAGDGAAKSVQLLDGSGDPACDAALLTMLGRSTWAPCAEGARCSERLATGTFGLSPRAHRPKRQPTGSEEPSGSTGSATEGRP